MKGLILPIGGVASGKVCACSLRSKIVYVMNATNRVWLGINSPWQLVPTNTQPKQQFIGMMEEFFR